jgi:hypothetical protein
MASLRSSLSSRRPTIRRGDLLVCALLISATAALYAPVLDYDFVRFDDPRCVSENPHIETGLTLQTVAWSFTSAYMSNWHPLTWLSHALDLELYGVDPRGHHATNAVLHVLNTLLLFGVLRSMTGQVWRSGFVAGLFALHPLHIESVAWVSERKDVLSAFFGLLSTWAYVRYTRLGGDRRQLIVVGLLFLGLLSKPMLVTLPFLFLLLDYWPLERWGPPGPRGKGSSQPSKAGEAIAASGGPSWRQLLLEKVPFLIAAATVSAFTVMAQRSGGALRASDVIPLPLRLANAPVSYLRYLAKTIWPTDLSVHYPHPNLPIIGGVPWAAWQVAGAVAVLALISVVVVRLHRQRYLLIGWLWYLGMLVPAIGIVQVGAQAMADRYSYLPIIGLFIAFTWGVGDAVKALSARLPLLRLALAPAAVIVLSAYAALSWNHLPTWRNSVTLFEQGLRVAPNDTIMLNNLGNEFVERGRLEEAILQYRRSIEVAPRHRPTHELLRDALLMKAARDRGE